MRLLPAAQVDYNILTNQKLEDFYFENVKLNVDAKKVWDEWEFEAILIWIESWKKAKLEWNQRIQYNI